jgi:hypothetical protein
MNPHPAEKRRGLGESGDPSAARPAALPPDALRAARRWLFVGIFLLAANLLLWKSLSRVGSADTVRLYRTASLLSLSVGFLALAVCAGLARREGASDRIRRLHGKIAERLGIGVQQIPLLTGAAGCALLASAAAGDAAKMTDPVIAPVAWGAGVILAAAGGWVKPASRRGVRPAAAWALLFFFAALAVRLVRVDLPPFSGDEGSTGMDAMMFLTGRADSLFRQVGFHSYPGFYFFIEALSVQALGRTVLALRITSVLAGALAAGALYLAARTLFGHRSAVIAAALLAVDPFDIVFSHIALGNIWDALGFTVFAGAAWHAWTNENRNAFLLAGAALGLSQFFYSTSRWLFVLAAGWMAAAFLLDRARFKRNAAGWTGLWAVAAAADLPLAFLAAARPDLAGGHILASSIFQPDWFPAAMQNAGTGFWGVLANQLIRGFGAFTFFPSGAWYRPWTPLLRPVEAAFFLCGVLLLLAKPKDPRSWLLLGWVAAFGAVGALSESAPSAQRYVGSAPALALLSAFGLSEIGARLPALLPSARRWAAPALAAVILFVAADNLHFTFGEYFPGSRFRGRNEFEGASIAVANRLIELLRRSGSPAEVVCLSGGIVVPHVVPSEQFLVPGFEAVFWNEPYGSADNPEPDASRLMFVFPAERESELAAVRRDYPGGESGAAYNWDGSLLFLYYEVTVTDR